MQPSRLQSGLKALGELLQKDGKTEDLVLVGGGALFLLGELERPTEDLDVLAKVTAKGLQSATPFPPHLVEAIRKVGKALDLPHEPRDQKDWLNSGPSFLTSMGLPNGFESRLSIKRFDALTIRLPARRDIVALKFFAATDIQ